MVRQMLVFPNSSDFDFETGDFTIDFWFNFTSIPLNMGFLGGNTGNWQIGFNNAGAVNKLYYYDPNIVGNYRATVESSFTLGQWYHLAFVRASGSLSYYVNGTKVGDSISFPQDALPISDLLIGSVLIGNYFCNGYMDELRINKGIARWTSDFTPPVSAYAPSGLIINMSLISLPQIADDVPIEARIVIFEEDVDSIILNTDLKAYISRDDGITWSQVTLIDEGFYESSARILSGNVSITSQPSDTDIRYKIVTDNNKNIKIHGTAVHWK